MSGSDYIVTETNLTNTNERLVRISPSGIMTVIATYPGQLRGLAIEGSNFIVTGSSSAGGNVLLRITPDGTVTTIASHISGGSALTDVVVLGSDYIVNYGNGSLLRIKPDGSVSTLVSFSASGLKVSNNQIIAAGNDGVNCLGRLYRISADGAVSVIASETILNVCSRYGGVATDGADFIVDSDIDGFKRIKPDGMIINIANTSINNRQKPNVALVLQGADIITVAGFPARLLRITQFNAPPSAVDVTSPLPPTNLTAMSSATSASFASITLTWALSTDNVGIAGYKIYRNGTFVASTASTSPNGTASFTEYGVPATTYNYTVAAYDAAGNVSVPSNPLSVTTAAPVASIPQVQGLRATVSGSSVALSWQAVTTSVAVDAYHVYRGSSADFVPSWASPTDNHIGFAAGNTLSYVDPQLSVGTYYYKVNVNAVNSSASAAVSAVITTTFSKPAVVTYEGVDGTWCYNTNTYYHPTVKGYCQDNTGTYSDSCNTSVANVVNDYSCGVFQINSQGGKTTRCVRDGWTCTGSLGNACSDGVCITASTTSSAITANSSLLASVLQTLRDTLSALTKLLQKSR